MNNQIIKENKMNRKVKYGIGALILTLLLNGTMMSKAFADPQTPDKKKIPLTSEGGGSGVGGGGTSKGSLVMGIALRALDVMNMLCKAKKASESVCKDNTAITKTIAKTDIQIVPVDETRSDDGNLTEASNNRKDTIWISKEWDLIVNSTFGSKRKLLVLIHELSVIAQLENSQEYTKSNTFVSELENNFINIHQIVSGETKLRFSKRNQVINSIQYSLENLIYTPDQSSLPKECSKTNSKYPTFTSDKEERVCIEGINNKNTEMKYNEHKNSDFLKQKVCEGIMACKVGFELNPSKVSKDFGGHFFYSREFTVTVTGFRDEVFAEE